MKKDNDIIGLFKTLNPFEKVMFVIAQLASCSIPFILFAMLGDLHWGWLLGTFITLVISMNVMKFSYNRRVDEKDKMNVSFAPKVKFG